MPRTEAGLNVNQTSRVVPIRLAHYAHEFWAKKALKAGDAISSHIREHLEAIASRGKRKKDKPK